MNRCCTKESGYFPESISRFSFIQLYDGIQTRKYCSYSIHLIFLSQKLPSIYILFSVSPHEWLRSMNGSQGMCVTLTHFSCKLYFLPILYTIQVNRPQICLPTCSSHNLVMTSHNKQKHHFSFFLAPLLPRKDCCGKLRSFSEKLHQTRPVLVFLTVSPS